jgi:hypothetical protein
MRTNGVPNYPYPSGPNDSETNFNGTGVDPNSPFVQNVNKVCGKKIGASLVDQRQRSARRHQRCAAQRRSPAGTAGAGWQRRVGRQHGVGRRWLTSPPDGSWPSLLSPAPGTGGGVAEAPTSSDHDNTALSSGATGPGEPGWGTRSQVAGHTKVTRVTWV